MFFFKSKNQSEELLPPPAPLPILESTVETHQQITEQKQVTKRKPLSKTDPEHDDLNEMINELNLKLKQKAPLKKIKNKPKTQKENLKRFQKKKIPQETKMINKDTIYLRDSEIPDLEKDFDLSNLSSDLPRKLEGLDFELPETLEEYDIGGAHDSLDDDFGKEIQGKQLIVQKPKEVIEAEEEIQGAIEKIKEQEKPSLFKRLFGKYTFEKETNIIDSAKLSNIPERDIQDNINRAKDALSKFDLDTAKKEYIEIIRIYNNMAPENQARVYNSIKELYFERKSAEELKV